MWDHYLFFALGSLTYVVAACRLDSLMSVVFLEGESSSTGEMKPSPSSSMWSRKLSTLRSGRTLTVNCVFVSPSSSEPSSSSCPEHRRGQMMSKGGKQSECAVALRREAFRIRLEDCDVLVKSGYKSSQCKWFHGHLLFRWSQLEDTIQWEPTLCHLRVSNRKSLHCSIQQDAL